MNFDSGSIIRGGRKTRSKFATSAKEDAAGTNPSCLQQPDTLMANARLRPGKAVVHSNGVGFKRETFDGALLRGGVRRRLIDG